MKFGSTMQKIFLFGVSLSKNVLYVSITVYMIFFKDSRISSDG